MKQKKDIKQGMSKEPKNNSLKRLKIDIIDQGKRRMRKTNN